MAENFVGTAFIQLRPSLTSFVEESLGQLSSVIQPIGAELTTALSENTAASAALGESLTASMASATASVDALAARLDGTLTTATTESRVLGETLDTSLASAATAATTVGAAMDTSLVGAGAKVRASMAEADAAIVATSEESAGVGTALAVAMGKGSSAAKTFAKDAESISPSLLGATGGLGTLAIAAAAVVAVSGKMASTFQASMEQLNTQAGVSQEKIAGLSDGVLNLAGQVGFSPNSLAQSLFHVESTFEKTGLTGKQAMDILKTAAEGARIGGSNLIDTQNALDAVVVSGISGVKNYAEAMGALNAAVGIGDMTMQNMADALSSGVVAVVKGYGVTIKDVAAGLAVFGDNNIRGAIAGTQLRMSVQALGKPIKGGEEMLNSIGISAKNLTKDMQEGGLNQALNDLVDHMNKAGVTGDKVGSFITDVFGKRVGAGLSVLTGQMGLFNDAFGKVDAASKTFGESWSNTQATVKQKIADLGSAFDALAIALGRLLLPVISVIIGVFTTLAQIIVAVVVPAFRIIGQVWKDLANLLRPMAEAIKSTLMDAWQAVPGIIHSYIVQPFMGIVDNIHKNFVTPLNDLLSGKSILITKSPLRALAVDTNQAINDLQNTVNRVKTLFFDPLKAVIEGNHSVTLGKSPITDMAVSMGNEIVKLEQIPHYVQTRFFDPLKVALGGKGSTVKIDSPLTQLAVTTGQAVRALERVPGDVQRGFIDAVKGVCDKVTIHNPLEQLAFDVGGAVAHLSTWPGKVQSQFVTPLIGALEGKKIKPHTALEDVAVTTGKSLNALQKIPGQVAKNFVSPLVTALSGKDVKAKNFVQQIAEGIGDAVRFMVTNIVPVVSTVVKFIVSKFAEIAKFWKSQGPEIIAIVQEIFGMIKAIITVAMAIIVPIVTVAVGILKFLWDSTGKYIIQAVQFAWDLITSVISAAMLVIQGVIEIILGVLSGHWSDAWKGIKDIVSGIWDLIYTIIKTALELVWTAIQAVLSLAWNFIKDGFQGVWHAIVDVWNGITGAIGSALSWIWDHISSAFNDVWNFIKRIWNDVINAIKSAWDTISGDIAKGVETAVNFVKGLPGKILDAIGNLGKLLSDVGGDIARGLWNGIKDAWHFVTDGINGLIKLIPKPVRDFLHIGSPSKLFADIGMQIPAGLAQGITGNTKIATQAVTNMARSLTSGLRSTLGTANNLTPAIATMPGITVKQYNLAVNSNYQSAADPVRWFQRMEQRAGATRLVS